MSKSTQLSMKPVRLPLPPTYDSSSPIVAVSCAARCMFIAQSNGDLSRLFLDQQEGAKLKFVTSASTGAASAVGGFIASIASSSATSPGRVDIASIFTSDSAYHTLIASTSGDLYHSTLDTGTAVAVAKWMKPHVVTSVAWTEENVDGTAQCLLGTQTGKLFLLTLGKSVEKSACRLASDIGVNEKVCDVKILSRSTVVACTPTCAYYWTTTNISTILSSPATLLFESPVSSVYSRFVPHADIGVSVGGGVTHVSWLSGVGIVTIPLYAIGTGTAEAVLVPVAVSPKSLLVTDLHYVVQVESGRVFLISRISTTSPVASISLSQLGPAPSPMFTESVGKGYLFTENRVFQLILSGESSDAWKHWLRKRNYSAAVKAASSNAERAYIYKHEADYILDSEVGGTAEAAAGLYVKAMREDSVLLESMFEEIVEKLGKVDKVGLLDFLIARLDASGGDDGGSREIVQITVVFVLCVHLFVELLADASCREKKEEVREKLYKFVQSRFESMDPTCVKTLMETLESVGLFEELVGVATVVGDIRTAVRTDLQLGNYGLVIDRLAAAGEGVDDKTALTLELGPLLFRFCPVEFVALLIRLLLGSSPRNSSSTTLPLQGVLQCLSSAGALSATHKDQASLFFNHWLSDDSRECSAAVLNLLIHLACEHAVSASNEDDLMLLIERLSRKAEFDSDFTLRSLRSFGLVRGEVVLLCVRGLICDAVRLALTLTDGEELAKQCASRPRSVYTRKLAWTLILHHYVRGRKEAGDEVGVVREVVSLFKEAEVLELVDVLPMIHEVTGGEPLVDSELGRVIVAEIANAVSAVKSKTEQTKLETANYTNALSLIRQDMNGNPNTCVLLSYSQKCDLCFNLLFEQRFLAFACSHCFHAECLKEALVKRCANSKDVETVIGKSCCLCGRDSLLMEQLFEPLVDPSVDAAYIDLWKLA